MRIGVVGFSAIGGSGVIAQELAVGLAERGHEVHLFVPAPPARSVEPRARLSLHVVDAPAHPALAHPPYALALASRLIEVGREVDLDLVHVHYAVPHAASALLAAHALAGRAPPIVVTLHGTDVTQVGADPAYHAVIAHALRAAGARSVPSAYLARRAREVFGLDDAIDVIPNFVDLERFRPAPRDLSLLQDLFPGIEADAPVLAHVSNFRPVKRPTDLVEVLARVRRQLPARMLFVGDGPERVATEAHARALGLEGAVRFVGERADHAALLRQADLFVLTSEDESFGLAALEAMACGVPVVAYRVGGLEEVVGEEAGVLVDPFDPDALAEAALRILAGERASMASAARARAEHYRRAPAIDRYEALYARVMGGRG